MAKKKLSDKKKLRNFFSDTLCGHRSAVPACRHFGDCGGCEFQDVPYEKQLEAKRAAFDFIVESVKAEWVAKEDPARADLIARLLEGVPMECVESPARLGYRQRMDYVFAFGVSGLRRVNRHRQVVDLEECPLLGEEGFAVYRKARRLAEEAGLESYDYMRHVGEVRYFVIRRSRNGQILLSLVTKTRDRREAVLSVLNRLAADGDIVSGHWLLAEGLGDVSFGRRLETVGRPWIVETMNGVSLRIGPNTFFQSNPAVAEKAYAAIRGFSPEGGVVLDMYSGVGSIALSVAPGAKRVLAVENVPDNVLLAETNVRENGAANIALVNADSTARLLELAENPDGEKPDMVIVNPPRPGVEGGGMEAIRRLAPGRFAYLSCNPFTLIRNLSEIADLYEVRGLSLYDMFPQTRHFECLALLERTLS